MCESLVILRKSIYHCPEFVVKSQRSHSRFFCGTTNTLQTPPIRRGYAARLRQDVERLLLMFTRGNYLI